MRGKETGNRRGRAKAHMRSYFFLFFVTIKLLFTTCGRFLSFLKDARKP